MRIYEGSPRQDFEEVLRSIGAFLDQRGMREISLVEVPDGFVVQGLVTNAGATGGWSESMGQERKESFSFVDDDIARFMDEAVARRTTPNQIPGSEHGGRYEQSLRVIGRYIDQEKPRDLLFFEQEGAYVLRLLMGSQAGARHMLAEFTREDLDQMIAQAPSLRNETKSAAASATQGGTA